MNSSEPSLVMLPFPTTHAYTVKLLRLHEKEKGDMLDPFSCLQFLES